MDCAERTAREEEPSGFSFVSSAPGPACLFRVQFCYCRWAWYAKPKRDCPRESASRDCPFLGGPIRNQRHLLRYAAKRGQTRLPRGLVRLGQSPFCSLVRIPPSTPGGKSRTAPLFYAFPRCVRKPSLRGKANCTCWASRAFRKASGDTSGSTAPCDWATTAAVPAA